MRQISQIVALLVYSVLASGQISVSSVDELLAFFGNAQTTSRTTSVSEESNENNFFDFQPSTSVEEKESRHSLNYSPNQFNCYCENKMQDNVRLFRCENRTLTPSNLLLRRLEGCNDASTYGNEVGKKNPNCLAFCTTDALGCLEGGYPSQSRFIQLIQREFPLSQHRHSIDHVKTCFQHYGSIDRRDKECSAAAVLSACIWSLQDKVTC